MGSCAGRSGTKTPSLATMYTAIVINIVVMCRSINPVSVMLYIINMTIALKGKTFI